MSRPSDSPWRSQSGITFLKFQQHGLCWSNMPDLGWAPQLRVSSTTRIDRPWTPSCFVDDRKLIWNNNSIFEWCLASNIILIMASTSKSGKSQPGGIVEPREPTKNEELSRLESIEIAGQVQELRADQALADLGYEPELSRNRSTFHVAFMSFVLASVPYGLGTSLFYPLINGGSATVIWGWVSVSLIIICVALSLGEITSVYPTAGGVYYQTFMLSPVRWRRLAAWICGWSYVAGNVVITLAVGFGTTSFVVACINVFEKEPGVGIFQTQTYHIYLLFLAITILCTATSALGNRHLPKLDVRPLALTHRLSDQSLGLTYLQAFATFWTLAALVATAICTLAIAKNGRHSGEYVFGDFEPLSGWTPGWAFCVGLLQAGYATSSTGMIIS